MLVEYTQIGYWSYQSWPKLVVSVKWQRDHTVETDSSLHQHGCFLIIWPRLDPVWKEFFKMKIQNMTSFAYCFD